MERSGADGAWLFEKGGAESGETLIPASSVLDPDYQNCLLVSIG